MFIFDRFKVKERNENIFHLSSIDIEKEKKKKEVNATMTHLNFYTFLLI